MLEIIKWNKEKISSQQQEILQLKQQIAQKDALIEESRNQYRDLTTDCLRLQLEKSHCELRIRGFPEQGDFRGWLKQEIDMKNVYDNDVISIQRRNSLYSTKNNLPRDIMVLFKNKMARDEILHKLDEKIRSYKGQAIKVFRELPFKLRQKRQIFKPFAAILRQNNLIYTWRVPEGLDFYFKSKKYSIKSKEEMQNFLSQHGKELSNQEKEQQKKEKKEDSSVRGSLKVESNNSIKGNKNQINKDEIEIQAGKSNYKKKIARTKETENTTNGFGKQEEKSDPEQQGKRAERREEEKNQEMRGVDRRKERRKRKRKEMRKDS